MAPASLSTEIAQPRSVRIAGCLSFVISIEMAPAGRILTPRGPFRAASTGQGFQIAWLLLFHAFRPPVQNVRRPTPDLPFRPSQRSLAPRPATAAGAP